MDCSDGSDEECRKYNFVIIVIPRKNVIPIKCRTLLFLSDVLLMMEKKFAFTIYMSFSFCKIVNILDALFFLF